MKPKIFLFISLACFVPAMAMASVAPQKTDSSVTLLQKYTLDLTTLFLCESTVVAIADLGPLEARSAVDILTNGE